MTPDELREKLIELMEKKKKETKLVKDQNKQTNQDEEKEKQPEPVVCVKYLFGTCTKGLIPQLCKKLKCYSPATVVDRLVHTYLEQQKKHVPEEVIEKAKQLWVKKYRDEFRPFEIAMKLIMEAAKILEKEKSGHNKPSPTEWITYF